MAGTVLGANGEAPEVWRSDFGTEVSGTLDAAARDSVDR